jgi:hypothetical protein
MFVASYGHQNGCSAPVALRSLGSVLRAERPFFIHIHKEQVAQVDCRFFTNLTKGGCIDGDLFTVVIGRGVRKPYSTSGDVLC